MLSHLERFVGEEDKLVVGGDVEGGRAQIDVGRVWHEDLLLLQGRSRRQHDRSVLVDEHHFGVCNRVAVLMVF